MRQTRYLLLAAMVTAAPGCKAPSGMGGVATALQRETPTLRLYGQGSRAGVVTACAATGYRQFDFWVGHWEVRGIRPDGTLGPVNQSIIERELDGCVIEENWTGVARSINTYDPAARTYNQQYIDANGWHLILVGGSPSRGSMEMSGTTFYSCAQCPNGVFPLVNIFQWTAITADSVRQLQRQINGLNGQPWQSGIGFDGRYRRLASVTLKPTPEAGACTSNPLHRQFDFLVGTWVVTAGRAHGRELSNGNGPVTARVTRELAGCLIEERVDGPGDYSGWSFNGWNQSELVWYRTYVNNLGDRVFLRGTLDGNRMVLTGTRALADGTSENVRVTWAADGADRITETWAVSRDGGATFEVEEEIVRIRREY